MKKTLLLAGVAALFASQSQAAEYNWMKEYQPYVGADYVYSNAKFGSNASKMRKAYSSGEVNVGVRMFDYLGLEGFYQQSGQRKRNTSDGSYKAEFLAYGLDLYGYEPLFCGNFNLLGSVGLANYRARFQYPDEKGKHQNRIGYRFGIGAQYALTENWAVRVMGRYTYLGMERLNNLKEVTAGLRYTF
jgi:opacity protein-like surface antigen